MRSIIIKYILVCGIIFSLLHVNAQEEYSDALFLSMTKTYTLNEDGSWEYNEIKKLKLLTYYSFHRLFGETFIVYDPDYQDLKINEAYTIMADGKKVVSPDNAFNEVLPRFAANAPAYNQLREMVVTHTGLERGAVINLDYTIKTSGDYFPAFMGEEILTERMPVKDMKVVIRVPADKELHHKVFNIRTSPEMTEENGMKVYVWIFSELSPASLESFQPTDQLLVPRLVFSTAKDLFKVLDDFTDQKAFYYKCNDQMKSTLSSMKEKDNELTSLLKIHKSVVNDVNYYNINPKYTGFKCRSAIETWESNGGTQLEKAVLLTSLFMAAGYDAALVGTIPTFLFDKSIGNLMTFSEVLVQVRSKEHGVMYFSPVKKQDNDYKYELADKTIVVIDPNIESLKTYQIENKENVITVTGDFTILDGTDLKGSVEVEVMNGLNPFFKLAGNQEAIKDLMKPAFSSKNITSFESLKVTEEVTHVSYEIEKSGIFKSQENYLFWKIPFSGIGFNNFHIGYLPEKREAPFELDHPLKESYYYTFSIPEDLALVTPEIDKTVKNDAGVVHIKINKKSDNIIEISKSLEIYNKLYKPVMYDEVKALIEVWINNNYSELVFKKTK